MYSTRTNKNNNKNKKHKHNPKSKSKPKPKTNQLHLNNLFPHDKIQKPIHENNNN